MLATVDAAACPELFSVADKYDQWAEAHGYDRANHFIVTKYEGPSLNIGYHYDKEKSIKKKSLITVVKIGAHGRPRVGA